MTPLENLLAKLPSAKQSSSGWSARCPAHDDHKASLSISQTNDGIVLLKCHAGCSINEVVDAIGLEIRDLFPPRPEWATGPTTRNGQSQAVARTFPTARDALDALDRQFGRHSHYWTYANAAGEPVGLVARWDRPDGKIIRPVSRRGDGWVIGAMPEPRSRRSRAIAGWPSRGSSPPSPRST
jgi:hypothetical protein